MLSDLTVCISHVVRPFRWELDKEPMLSDLTVCTSYIQSHGSGAVLRYFFGVLMHIIPDPGGSPRHNPGTDQANDREAGIRSMAFSFDFSRPSTESSLMHFL